MKKILSLIAVLFSILFGAPQFASAGTTNIYVQDWGTVIGTSSVNGNGNIGTVGWTGVEGGVPTVGPPYLGIYQATGASDPASGAALPINTVYFTTLTSPNQTAPGMFYTVTGAGAGSGGDSAFVDINPTLYTNLTLSVEVRGAATDTNYFAVRVGGSWYVATSYQLPSSGILGYPQFTNATLLYTNAANVWHSLTINATSVTIGLVATPSLTSPITGIGIVQLPTGGGFNYNQLAVTAFTPNAVTNPATITATPISQTAYAGGGASFLMLAAGTPPLTYIWQANGVTLTESSKYSGTTNNVLTIRNVDANDAAASYSVIVTNSAGGATNSGFTLTVNPVPPDFLYAETFPYVGPNGNLPVTGVGWQVASGGTDGIYSSGVGIGNVFSYSATANTNFYAATTNDNGASGLPFLPINPASYPAVTFQANFTPGNGAALDSSNVVAYWAVQMANGAWYSSAKRIPVQTITLNSYQPYQLGFNSDKTNWNTLTIGATSATIGAQAGSTLTGSILGAGVVIAHLGLNGGGDFNFNSFVVTTNAVTVLPPFIGINGSPNSQTVASGGGASFGVSATGQQPFTYGWTLNGAPLHNGGRISGATTPTLTIANLTSSDSGSTIVAFVTNSVGVDESDFYTGTTVTVIDPPVGLLYSETFPFVGPIAGNYPIGGVGWVEAVPGVPNALFQTIGSDGAVFAYLGTPAATAYYTSTATDTNQAGLPFPNINVAAYPDLTLAVDIAPTFSSSNVTAFITVQLNGANWYVAANPLPVPTAFDSGSYATYSAAFNPAAANWKNLALTGSGALIGSTAAGNLKGVMTGAGLVFVTVGTGGNFNFDNFAITGSGLGAINVGPLTGGSVNLSWVGNPVVNLQSTTNLSTPNWQDVVPGTLGLYSLPVSVTGPQKYFRLVQHP